MINYIGFFIGGVFLFYAVIFVWSKFFDCKINYKNPWVYISIFFLTLLSIFISLHVNAFIKMLVISLFMGIANKIIFKRNINEIFISTIYCELLATLSDSIFAIILIFLFGKNLASIKTGFFDTLIGNVAVALIYIGINYIPCVKKIYISLVDLTDRLKNRSLVMWCLLVIFSINFLVATIYYDMTSIFVIIINCLLIIIYSLIVYRSINDRNNSILIKAENESLMKSLGEYENMLDRQRVDNHENKNQLLIIKNMISKNDKSVIDYIDTVIKDKKEDDEILYTKVKKIPSGGLQGIIYQKMLVMKDKNINFSIDVSRDVRKIDLDNFDMNDNYKLCKIIGVFLDNAIEAIDDVVDKYIMISLYVEDEMLIIDISNKFSGVLDLDCIDNEGYTTKENGHGYGLSLVKKLVDESTIFINERKINNDVFKQIIKVKVK